MSKMDNLRAMREAKFERSSGRPGATKPSATRAKPAPVAPVEPHVDAGVGAGSGTGAGTGAGEETDPGLCGHRAISGRTCTRERGHSARSHRYS